MTQWRYKYRRPQYMKGFHIEEGKFTTIGWNPPMTCRTQGIIQGSSTCLSKMLDKDPTHPFPNTILCQFFYGFISDGNNIRPGEGNDIRIIFLNNGPSLLFGSFGWLSVRSIFFFVGWWLMTGNTIDCCLYYFGMSVDDVDVLVGLIVPWSRLDSLRFKVHPIWKEDTLIPFHKKWLFDGLILRAGQVRRRCWRRYPKEKTC